MATLQVPGVQVAVIDDGRVAWSRAWGVYDGALASPMTNERLLQVASISKPTTALGLLTLADAGAVDLDAPLEDALGSWPVPDNAFTQSQPVTPRNTLSHGAGFNNSGFIGYPAGTPPLSLVEVLTGTGTNHPPVDVVQEPNESWMYSGGGYVAIAQAVEDVGGMPFPEWMQANVLDPLGMLRSNFRHPPVLPEANGQIAGLNALFFPPVVHPELSAAGLWSTATEIAQLVIGMQQAIAGEPGALLSPAVAAELVTPQLPEPAPLQIGLSPDPQMGLGLFLADGPSPKWFWHTGSNLGFQSVFIGSIDNPGRGVVVLTNGFPGGRPLSWEIVNGVVDVYGWSDWDDWGL